MITDKDSNIRKHTILSNIFYAIKNIWNWDKAFFLWFVPIIPIRVFLPLMSIYFSKILIDIIIVGRSLQNIIFTICAYFIMLFFINLLNSYCDSKIGMRRYNLSIIYQNEITQKHMRTDYSNTDNPDINLKYSHAMNDAASGGCAPEFIFESILSFLISIVGILTYGSIIAILSPLVLILVFMSTVVTYLTGRWQRRYIEKNKDEQAKIDRKIGYISSFSSNFEYAKDIRLYGMLEWISSMLENLQKDKFVWNKKVSLNVFFGSCINFLLNLFKDSAAYIILIIMLLNESISVGDFVFYFGAIAGISAWFNGISGNINDIVEKGIKIGYYRDYFNVKEIYNHGNGCRLPEESEIPVDIEFKNVFYKYPASERFTLKNINLKINKGEKLTIVGVNGAGKTTLVKILCGFYFPTEGEIRVNGQSILSYNIEEYYSLFSVVFQDIYLLPITIAEFVSSSDEKIDRSLVEKCLADSGLEDKISSLHNGIDSRLMKGIFDDSIDLSGGEKQKLMFSRALYKNAPIVVLDEPTAALDSIAENELYQKYNELTINKTSIYISHRLASTRFCDRIIFINSGEIIEIGSHDELMKQNGSYAEMFNMQSQYYKEEGVINNE